MEGGCDPLLEPCGRKFCSASRRERRAGEASGPLGRSAQREAFDKTLMHALRLVSDANKVQPSCSYASTPSAIRLRQSLLASLMYAASRLHSPSPTLSHSFLHPPTSPPPDLVRFVMKQWDGQLSGSLRRDTHARPSPGVRCKQGPTLMLFCLHPFSDSPQSVPSRISHVHSQ